MRVLWNRLLFHSFVSQKTVFVHYFLTDDTLKAQSSLETERKAVQGTEGILTESGEGTYSQATQ